MSDIDLSTTELKASYGVGMQMGQQLKAAFKDVSLAAAIAGLKDGFNNQPPRVEGDAINAAFQEIQAAMAAESQAAAAEHSQEGEAFLAENAKREEITVTESGLQYEVHTQGDGEVPTLNSTVRVHYHGTLLDGSVFDSSYDRGQPAEFPVNGVIKGWTEALQFMKAGTKLKLHVPAELAYGEQGAGGAISPHSTLIFDVELLDIIS